MAGKDLERPGLIESRWSPKGVWLRENTWTFREMRENAWKGCFG
jgi:hypothetical protein